ncbi:hypothetical protein [Flavobacterium sp.]|uniref:hypothetical protein n=1 Tax=Flavobacterium sp. TaxID=239 RepID=UPI001B4712F6|nr:hypothetical protein [Flavobacterium sp.]MBP6128232.1 hypothetical protein [Flavobacterium sp.]
MNNIYAKLVGFLPFILIAFYIIFKEAKLKFTTKSEAQKQYIWEAWFVSGVILLLACIFIGTVSAETIFPYHNYVTIASFLNVATCLYYGNKTPKY